MASKGESREIFSAGKNADTKTVKKDSITDNRQVPGEKRTTIGEYNKSYKSS